MKEYAGIDVSLEYAVCVVDADGRDVREASLGVARREARFSSLRQRHEHRPTQARRPERRGQVLQECA